jgi:hypothetical protein
LKIMTDPKLPEFLSDEPLPAPDAEFRPEQDRRGEWVAWAGALAAALVMALQTELVGEASAFVITLFVVVIVAAFLITYANWMERNTSIVLTPGGVRYASPLRKTEMRWSQIDEIWLAPARSAWRVSVVGQAGQFNFQTLLTMESIAGKARMGIPGGKQLAAHIIRKSGLVHPRHEDGIWIWERQPE